MKKVAHGFALLLLPLLARADFSGNLALEAIVFTEDAQYAGQMDDNLTASFKPKWNGEWNQGDDLWSIELFMRADDKDSGREHADIRELLWLHLDGDNEWRVGINTMFWGVTESQHLVDVINQLDQVEGIDGEDKLGQPMIHLKRYQDWGVLDFLVLPGFRERHFRSVAGRLRAPLIVDEDQAAYESADGQQHADLALRFSQTYDKLDLGLSLFDGTRREPLLRPGFDANAAPVLIPYYEQMTQLGVDALLIDADWIWKLELVHREADSSDMNAYTFGFEYTFYGILSSAIDFGAIAEYSYDDRAEGLRGVFDRDLFVGGRFAFNDAQSSELLAGMLLDTDKQSRSFRVEASRRLGESYKASLELQVFSNIDASDPLAALKQDDFVLLELAYFF